MEKKYRIAIDIRDLKKAKTGTFTYLNEIVKALNAQHQFAEIVLLDYPFHVYTGKNYLWKSLEHLLFFIWKQLALPLLCLYHNCDFLLCTDYFSPVIRFKTNYYTVFHDCFFFDHPEYYNKIWHMSFKTLGVWGAKQATGIIVPSYYVKTRLSTLQPVLNKKIHVVYEGHADFSNLSPYGEADAEWDLIRKFVQQRKFILYVGTLDKRKNLDRLLEAFGKMPTALYEQICLILAGSSPSYKGSDHTIFLKGIIDSNFLGNNVLMTGRVSQQTLKNLYQHADFLIQPSIDEGFGLPIVEAIHFGLPFAAANNTAMPEIGGGAGIYFDPYDVEEIKDAISLLYHDETLKKELIQKGMKLASRYDWDLATRQIMDIFISKCSNEA